MNANEIANTEKHPAVTFAVSRVLAVWLALVFLLSSLGGFVRPPGSWPIPLLMSVVVPLILFLAAYRTFATFRAFLFSMDLGLMTGIQAWRFAGLGFLALYAHGVLPGAFALPAGLGDMAIGLTAPWMALRVARKPASVSSGSFVVWNLLGILDLIIAVGMGAVGSALAVGIPGEITTAPMARLPLVLIPAYFVPLFVMLHFAALFQARRQAISEHSEGRSERICAVTARQGA